jgi:hypothetical protein
MSLEIVFKVEGTHTGNCRVDFAGFNVLILLLFPGGLGAFKGAVFKDLDWVSRKLRIELRINSSEAKVLP